VAQQIAQQFHCSDSPSGATANNKQQQKQRTHE
jgi:hypothetical protein